MVGGSADCQNSIRIDLVGFTRRAASALHLASGRARYYTQ
jgi:hypothetical protein